MRYRKLDANKDMVFGHQQSDFYINVPEAVAQAVQSRLSLQLGDWFLDTSDGTDWNGKILGNYTSLTRDAEIRSRTMLTPGVSSMTNYNSQFNPSIRAWASSFSLDTIYGALQQLTTEFITPSSVPTPIMPSQLTSVGVQQETQSTAEVTWTPGV